MLDQSRVRSGFDAEILLGERQLTYALLALVDAGRIPISMEFGGTRLGLRGPTAIDRNYEPHPGAVLEGVSETRSPFAVEVLFDHALGADLRVHPVIDVGGLAVEADVFASLRLETTNEPDGSLASAQLHIVVVDIDSPALPFIESEYGLDKATLLAEVKQAVDRTADLGSVGAFKRLQALALRKLPAEGEHAAALGLYVNLRLQNGPRPDELLGERGDVALARNFLPAGSDLAMATRAGLFGDLADDAFHRYAEIDEDGHVSHPWRKSINNPRSEKIGKIKGVSVGPSAVLPNALRIDVHVEYEIDNWFDPDGHLVLTLVPRANGQGLLVWAVDADFRGSLAMELLGLLVLASLFTGAGALVGLGFGAALTAGVITGTLADALAHHIVDALYSGRVERKVDAALPDVVSGRVEIARRRWDPLYTTLHQVAMRPDGALVNGRGVALWGRAVLDRQIEPVPHAVIRDVRIASPEPPTHLRYRVRDAEALREDFRALAPGTDRRDIGQHDPDGEPTLYELSIAQVSERLDEGRIVPDLAYLAQQVHVKQHQVSRIRAISQRERNEVRTELIIAFNAEQWGRVDADQGEAIRADVIREFEEAGVEATPEEIQARVEERIAEIVKPLVDAYIEGPLARELEAALQPLLRLELAPEHFGALQREGILHLLELELIRMRNGTLYYRDQPDGYLPDNLMRRPRYTSGTPVPG